MDGDKMVKYDSLSDIRHQKEMALAKIRANNKEIGFLWKSIFEKPKKSNTPQLTFSNVMKTGIGVFDALLFAWKMYRRFKR